MLTEHDDTGCRKLAALVEAQLGITVSERTLQRIAKDEGMRWLKDKRVIAITAENQAKRVAWAKSHRNDDFSDWVFSDEKIFRRGGVGYHRCKPGKRRKQPSNKWSGSVHIWWAISPNFKISPVILR
jgi:hypothetical protein